VSEQKQTAKGCEGCRFGGAAERCKTCSRKYLDRWEASPPRKPMSKGTAMVLASVLTMAAMADRRPCE